MNRLKESKTDPKDSGKGAVFERNLLFAGGVIGGIGDGERGSGGREGRRRLKFEGRMINSKERAVPDG